MRAPPSARAHLFHPDRRPHSGCWRRHACLGRLLLRCTARARCLTKPRGCVPAAVVPNLRRQVLDAVRAQLELHGDSIKVASFSQIISLPAAILPVKELVDLCHECVWASSGS